MAYFWYKAFHIIGVVVWFAGLFYLVRLFIYHVEANDQPEPAQSILKQQYLLMEKRLYNIITTPGMIVTVAMAIGLLTVEPEVLHQPWMHTKFGVVGLLLIYHFYCGRVLKQLENGTCGWSSQQLRVMNELPTVFLLVTVLLVVFKESLPTNGTVWVIAASVLLMAVGIQFYARKRRLDRERDAAQAATLKPAE
ncbi:MAG: protoporphyrinogen oxidase HemJ [Prochlorotrichaceae cyanobacterium]|jgi:putative membrane protein